jgi:hypothetical protein
MIGNRSKLFTKSARIALLACSLLAACSSPEEQERKRELAMQTMAGTVIQHLLDRNPETIEASMNVLTRDEMIEPLVSKLQSEKIIPETVLNVRLIMEDAQKNHSSNQIVISNTKPLDDPKQQEVSFQVTGKDVRQLNGKPTGEKPFEYTVTCKLTPAMNGLARVTNLVIPGATTKTAEADAQPSLKKRHRRSR